MMILFNRRFILIRIERRTFFAVANDEVVALQVNIVFANLATVSGNALLYTLSAQVAELPLEMSRFRPTVCNRVLEKRKQFSIC